MSELKIIENQTHNCVFYPGSEFPQPAFLQIDFVQQTLSTGIYRSHHRTKTWAQKNNWVIHFEIRETWTTEAINEFLRFIYPNFNELLIYWRTLQEAKEENHETNKICQKIYDDQLKECQKLVAKATCKSFEPYRTIDRYMDYENIYDRLAYYDSWEDAEKEIMGNENDGHLIMDDCFYCWILRVIKNAPSLQEIANLPKYILENEWVKERIGHVWELAIATYLLEIIGATGIRDKCKTGEIILKVAKNLPWPAPLVLPSTCEYIATELQKIDSVPNEKQKTEIRPDMQQPLLGEMETTDKEATETTGKKKKKNDKPN